MTSIQVLHPEQHTEPSPGKTTWHFHTLAWRSVNIRKYSIWWRFGSRCWPYEDSSLESVVDWLADDVARALPNFPPWLCVLRFDQDLSVSDVPSSDKKGMPARNTPARKRRGTSSTLVMSK